MALQDYLVPVSNPNICFDCQKACGGCSWSRDFTPVPGWTATKKTQKIYVGGTKKHRYEKTYHITACPEFVPDEKRESSHGELTERQLELLISRMKRNGEW